MEYRLKSTKILGVNIHCLTRNGLVETFLWAINNPSDKPIRFTYANTHVLNMTYEDESFRSTVNSMDIVYADGIGPVIAGRILNTCKLEKMTGADWIHPVAVELAKHGLRIFILAGKPGVAEKAGQYLTEEYPGIKIAGTADGYFHRRSESAVQREIVEARPDVLFVGMGSPKQEAWVNRSYKELPVKVVWAVGALFDYLAGEERRAPQWALSLGLEWAWRLLMDPGGKWKRYLVGNPLFLVRVLRQRFRISE